MYLDNMLQCVRLVLHTIITFQLASYDTISTTYLHASIYLIHGEVPTYYACSLIAKCVHLTLDYFLQYYLYTKF